jgi:hypothetical protein
MPPRADRQVEQEGRARRAEEAPADRERVLGAVRSWRRLRPRPRQAMTTTAEMTTTGETTIEAMTR